MYRALITISDSESTRLGATRVRAKAGNVRDQIGRYASSWYGSHHGDPGIWIQAVHKDMFRQGLETGVAVAAESGWHLTAVCLNQPSYEVASEIRGLASTR